MEDGTKDAPAILYQGLSRTYGSGFMNRRSRHQALDSVSFSIAPGETVGLIGPNGAGKTTLLALTAGLLRPDGGQVFVCGHPARSVAARRYTGYMTETPTFQELYTAREVLYFHAALLRLPRARAKQEVEALLDLMDLRHAEKKPTRTYSQGMKQRLALVVALLGRPRVLLLDEPTNGLDPAGMVRLRQLLAERSREGTTVLISSHHLSELQQLATRYIFLEKGHVVHAEGKCVATKRVRVRFLPGQPDLASRIPAVFERIEVSETEAVIAVRNADEIADIVRQLVGNGLRIVGVEELREGVEEMFVRVFERRA